MVATGKQYRQNVEQSLLHDLYSSTVSQAIVSEVLASHYRRHLKRPRAINLQSRNVMLRVLKRCFLEEISWNIPKGG